MDLFSRCFSGMAGDCKIGKTKRIKVKVGKKDGLGRGLDYKTGMAHQLNFQTAAYEK
jgi:hypothetical protein